MHKIRELRLRYEANLCYTQIHRALNLSKEVNRRIGRMPTGDPSIGRRNAHSGSGHRTNLPQPMGTVRRFKMAKPDRMVPPYALDCKTRPRGHAQDPSPWSR